MSDFTIIRDKLLNHINQLIDECQYAYSVDLDKDDLYNLYLDSFPAGINEIYRERREHDCSACRYFIKTVGNIVFIKDNKPVSIWDFDVDNNEYEPSFKAMSTYVYQHDITDIFLSPFRRIGTVVNREETEGGKIISWTHFYMKVPNTMYCKEGALNSEIAKVREAKQLLESSLEVITKDSVETVLELIAQNSLYRGDTWIEILENFNSVREAYESLDDKEKNCFLWRKVKDLPHALTHLKNTSMGTLLVDVSESMNLDRAVRKYEKVVAPENYQRSKPIYTKQMLEEARKKIDALGYMNSLKRRYATLNDITINNILFANRDVKKELEVDIFDEMSKDLSVDPKKFSKVEEISIDNFIDNVLPTAKEVEVLFENRHTKNLVSLIAPSDITSKSMFKWNNSFSWAYTGNIADSTLKENVKKAGGRVDGVLRFSIQWNDIELDKNDLDAHCKEPEGGQHINFIRKVSYKTGGNLDVDIIRPVSGKPAVENITYPTMNRMIQGDYEFYVYCFNYRGGKKGFRAEIEFDGKTFQYNYDKAMRKNEKIKVATVHFDGQQFTIKHHLNADSSIASKEIWNINTLQFIPVNVICYSPNYWDENQGVGNKHVFFMLKDCINPEQPNAFYNEYLTNDLKEHRKVLEALGSKLAVTDADSQLSGIGFSTTKRDELVVKVKGHTERVLRIKI
ncbi:MAG: hypothetical protein LUH02_07195 [Erysipelotrichaceae bacterium]|nr:hypothetical protein [Erysipelotrichaceae bacterium]